MSERQPGPGSVEAEEFRARPAYLEESPGTGVDEVTIRPVEPLNEQDHQGQGETYE